MNQQRKKLINGIIVTLCIVLMGGSVILLLNAEEKVEFNMPGRVSILHKRLEGLYAEGHLNSARIALRLFKLDAESLGGTREEYLAALDDIRSVIPEDLPEQFRIYDLDQDSSQIIFGLCSKTGSKLPQQQRVDELMRIVEEINSTVETPERNLGSYLYRRMKILYDQGYLSEDDFAVFDAFVDEGFQVESPGMMGAPI